MTANIKEYLLGNKEELKDVVREINGWNGALDHLEVYENDEEFFETFFHGKVSEAVRAAHYGEYDYMDELVRFNGYANLETLSEYEYEKELTDSIDEIVENLIEYSHELFLSDDLTDLIEAYEEDEE